MIENDSDDSQMEQLVKAIPSRFRRKSWCGRYDLEAGGGGGGYFPVALPMLLRHKVALRLRLWWSHVNWYIFHVLRINTVLASVTLPLRRTVFGLRLKRIEREFVIKDDIKGVLGGNRGVAVPLRHYTILGVAGGSTTLRHGPRHECATYRATGATWAAKDCAID